MIVYYNYLTYLVIIDSMNISKDELIAVLSQFNPWWKGEKISELPKWQRATYGELLTWNINPPAPRAILLFGARQVGKTTLLLQIINALLNKGVPASNILYTTFDHPAIKLAGIDAILAAWRTREPKAPGPEYLFLDEAQFIRDSGTWVKHQVDFNKERRITFTGSAMPLIHKEQESGVGRWHTIKLSTLSFYEYLQLKRINPLAALYKKAARMWGEEKTEYDTRLEKLLKSDIEILLTQNNLPQLKSLKNLFDWPQEDFYRTSEIATPYIGHFNEYLVRGGFPQTAQTESIFQAQKLLREDIIDKVLKRDMTALFGVRRVLELEQTFLYLCMHDGGLLDLQTLSSNLGVNRSTAQHFIELLEAAHLIYRLQPFGYGKEVLRGKYKIYLADAAIASAVLLKGKAILEDTNALSIATETAVLKHLFTRYYQLNIRFNYWQNSKKQEVDLVATIDNKIIPFEVKYRSQHTDKRALKGFQKLCQEKSVERGYIVTKSIEDFGPLELPNLNTKVMRIPAPLLCYWMGEAELTSQVGSLNSGAENII